MSNKTSIREEIESHGYIVFPFSGVSMLPFLRQKEDVVVITARGDKALCKYDAVLFLRANGAYVLHRILKVKGDQYLIVGDNCEKGEWVHDSAVIGILTQVVRGDKRISVNTSGYETRVKAWVFLYPLRRVIYSCRPAYYGFREKLGKFRRKILHFK